MNRAWTIAALLCMPGLIVSPIGLSAGPSHGAGYSSLAIFWKASSLLILATSRLSAAP